MPNLQVTDSERVDIIDALDVQAQRLRNFARAASDADTAERIEAQAHRHECLRYRLTNGQPRSDDPAFAHAECSKSPDGYHEFVNPSDACRWCE